MGAVTDATAPGPPAGISMLSGRAGATVRGNAEPLDTVFPAPLDTAVPPFPEGPPGGRGVSSAEAALAGALTVRGAAVLGRRADPRGLSAIGAAGDAAKDAPMAAVAAGTAATGEACSATGAGAPGDEEASVPEDTGLTLITDWVLISPRSSEHMSAPAVNALRRAVVSDCPVERSSSIEKRNAQSPQGFFVSVQMSAASLH